MLKLIRLLRIPGMSTRNAVEVSAALRQDAARAIPPAVDPHAAAQLASDAESVRRAMERRGRYLYSKHHRPEVHPMVIAPEVTIPQFQRPRLIR